MSGRASSSNLELIVFGGLIIFFLVVEPARPRAAVADRQGKAAAMAIPALIDALQTIGRGRCC